MPIVVHKASTVIFLVLSLSGALLQPAMSSPSVQGFHSRARLLSGGALGEFWLAGIEITLDQGFKTYWRNPGESGLPPRFDWSASENVSGIDVRWPAPSRHEDAAGVAYTYGGRVILPVLIKAAEPGKPVKLVLSADYGVCKDICIPAHADLTATVPDSGADRAAIEGALAKVPHLQPLGAQADLSIVSVTSPAQGGKPTLTVATRVPGGTKGQLFAEGPENWYLSTSPADDQSRFTVVVEEKPKNAVGPVSLRLTLVAGGKAIESEASLDGSGQPR